MIQVLIPTIAACSICAIWMVCDLVKTIILNRQNIKFRNDASSDPLPRASGIEVEGSAAKG